VPEAFLRWSRKNKAICIFSSGSVLAQQLLFANTNCGDLSPFLHRYFDTVMGAKNIPESYKRIASSLNLRAASVLFISDTVGELDAARTAELKTAWCARGTNASSIVSLHATIHSFDSVLP